MVVTTLFDIAEQARSCTLCALSETRRTVVFGSGSETANLLILGEAPGANEDESGVPFVGRSGRLLDKLCEEELGLGRDEIYVANVLKCRPPDNRDPRPNEISTCRPYLQQQLSMIRPKVVIPVGNFAARFLLSTKLGITKLRGQSYRGSAETTATVVPTFHPAAVLRGGKQKMADMREDFQLARRAMDGSAL